MNKLLSFFILSLILTSCNQKADNISTEKASNNNPISVESTNNLQTYKNDKFGIEFQYGLDYEITEDAENSFSLRKIGDLEEQKNGDGVCLNCSFNFVFIPKFLGNTEIKTPEEWLETQKKVDMNYVEKLISGKKAYYYKDKENLREYYLVYVKNGDNYDRYDFSFKVDDTNASKILSSIKFKENIESSNNLQIDEIKEKQMKKFRDSTRVNDLKQLQGAIEIYYSDKSKLPEKLKLEEELTNYLPSFRKETLGNITKDGCDFGYIYEILDENKGKFKISTCLEDGKSLTENDGGSYSDKFEVGNFLESN